MKKLTKHYKKTLILLSVFFCFIIFLLIYCFYPIINYKENIENKPGNILLYDRNWKVITDKAKENWYFIKYILNNKNIKFIDSLIKIEDKNFYSNFGINILSKLRAIKDNLSWRQISGASTITEQFIKNKYFKNYNRTYLQKIRESILALYFSNRYSKEEILGKYLNTIYLWNKIYWIKWAIKIYFNKEKLEKLTNEEITILISLIHNPWIKNLEEENFQNYFNKVKNRLNFNLKRTYFWELNFKKNIDKLPFIKKLYWEDLKYNNKIKTSIDLDLQEFTKKIIKKNLDRLKWKNVTNSAVFAIIPKTWEVLIYQGSKDFYAKDIDWEVDVIQAKRQPWSTVKPFLYLLALEKLWWPDSLIIDLVSEYNSFVDWKTYISENYSLIEYWLVRLKKALWNSMNNASVRLWNELWLENVFDFYKKYWFEFDYDARHYWYSLVLWNAETTLEKLVRNYSKLIPNNFSHLDKEGVKGWSNKFLLQDILSDPDNRDISFWVNSILNTSIAQAVKTGTSSDFRDNWVISYHPDLVVWVWVWNNDNSSMIWVTWISWAGAIWHSIIEKAIELWYIKKLNNYNPSAFQAASFNIKGSKLQIEEWEYCLDKNCFRKELIYKKKWVKYYSRIRDWFFSKKDLIEKLTDFEKDKLKKMWIILK